MKKNKSDIIRDLIERVGGSYSRNLSPNLSSPKKILDRLKPLWKDHGLAGMDITDFEAALVREGIEKRRRKR